MKKRNIRGFFVGEKGQRLFNYAYSIGASIVILGALFKLLHAPMADAILIIGMGTEAVIFFLSAFDEPAKDYKWEKVYPELDIPNDEEAALARLERIKEGGSIIAPSAPAANVAASAPAANVAASAPAFAGVPSIAPLNVNTDEVSDATQKYVEQLKSISEQMVALNRSVQGIEAIYEVQLKSASSQLGSVEQVSEQTKQLVQNLQQLNELYGRMISAMAPSQQKQ